jgi:NAD(P)H dehydrogenase (quinone)
MRVLVVNAYPAAHADSSIVQQAIDMLHAQGHEIEHLSLEADEFATMMTAQERTAYESDAPLLADETKASAASVQAADALLFCYPTTLFGPPPRLKSWLERVMVMGVAFVFDDKQRMRPGLRNIRRIGVITTTSHSTRTTLRARDLGYRTFMRTLRLNCHLLCRRTFVRMPTEAPAGRYVDRLHRALRSW